MSNLQLLLIGLFGVILLFVAVVLSPPSKRYVIVPHGPLAYSLMDERTGQICSYRVDGIRIGCNW